jgi:hypothetical protein
MNSAPGSASFEPHPSPNTAHTPSASNRRRAIWFGGARCTSRRRREPYHSNREKRYSGYRSPTHGTHWSHGTMGPMHNGPKPPERVANSAPPKFLKTLQYQTLKSWRRERDSNPRYTCAHNGFRDRPVQPLRHPSAVGHPVIGTAYLAAKDRLHKRAGQHLDGPALLPRFALAFASLVVADSASALPFRSTRLSHRQSQLEYPQLP